MAIGEGIQRAHYTSKAWYDDMWLKNRLFIWSVQFLSQVTEATAVILQEEAKPVSRLPMSVCINLILIRFCFLFKGHRRSQKWRKADTGKFITITILIN